MKKTIIGTLIALGLVASFSGCEKKVEAEVNATEVTATVEENTATPVETIEANASQPVVETAETAETK